jgi:hypothetical protein
MTGERFEFRPKQNGIVSSHRLELFGGALSRLKMMWMYFSIVKQ